MKVLLLNTSELSGGAAVAANRLMHALRNAGQDVKMLVRDKQSDDPHVVSIQTSWLNRKINFIRFAWERLIIFFSNRCSRMNLFQVSVANTGTDISKHPLIKEADMIHIHWINQGFLSLKTIRRIVETGKPVVWTLHDLWSATGICHYPGACEQYKTECLHCPKQAKHPFLNLAKRTFKRKERIQLSKVAFVGCSKWIASSVACSTLLHGASIVSIPNPIDISVFKPVDRREARIRLNLPADKQLILFIAAKISDSRKGITCLTEACRKLHEKKTMAVEIVLVGKSTEELTGRFPFAVRELGYVSDSETMVMAYSGADVFVIPSLEDNLPNTILDAMACGTPCVGFNVGGIPEMIDHKINGYIAKYKDADDLAAGIEWVLENKESAGLPAACLKKVQENYTEPVVAEKYINLYRGLMEISETKEIMTV
jgi:glycosyltransferase involved in cell wall biosynthesis